MYKTNSFFFTHYLTSLPCPKQSGLDLHLHKYNQEPIKIPSCNTAKVLTGSKSTWLNTKLNFLNISLTSAYNTQYTKYLSKTSPRLYRPVLRVSIHFAPKKTGDHHLASDPLF